MKKTINWGIIGLGKIANKFATDLAKVPDAQLYAVASRERKKALDFAKKFDVQTAYGTYEQLMQDELVDVIYIATPHVFHHKLTLDCLKNGKAVLCEKPFAMNLEEAIQMVDLSREKHIFLMEALWTRFLPHFKFVRNKIQSGELGSVLSLNADFGFKAEFDRNKRLFNKSLGGGSLLDIGIYPVFLAYAILGKPEEISATAEFSETGVDSSCTMNFIYENGVIANLFSTLLEKTGTTAEIELEKGNIILNSRFHEPTSVTVVSNGKKETITFDVNSNGYNFETEHVNEMLKEGKAESDLWTLDNTLDVAELLDKIKREIGLEYRE
ncbi:Gfo/Idh/MocA family protein [Christiangramia sabulilitoris]|uniref:Gfo/Idh/MocA family oxidoreductase n=1 Tax=Christiangramia sabulilitoris TaxID=2583991 RepID=A0A550I5R5_9FLAO|nr:Gfo/Idh/MocA family oxidoreductase [Christiangramia sabulilitoris]TRO66320.1 Gfo/Idh/MocA family oxidoreductase [Christiangramia sabulilitoris]